MNQIMQYDLETKDTKTFMRLAKTQFFGLSLFKVSLRKETFVFK